MQAWWIWKWVMYCQLNLQSQYPEEWFLVSLQWNWKWREWNEWIGDQWKANKWCGYSVFWWDRSSHWASFICPSSYSPQRREVIYQYYVTDIQLRLHNFWSTYESNRVKAVILLQPRISIFYSIVWYASLATCQQYVLNLSLALVPVSSQMCMKPSNTCTCLHVCACAHLETCFSEFWRSVSVRFGS